MVFIDADKSSYPIYLEKVLSRSQPGQTRRILKPGGLIIADNVLRRGLVADSSDANPWSKSECCNHPLPPHPLQRLEMVRHWQLSGSRLLDVVDHLQSLFIRKHLAHA